MTECTICYCVVWYGMLFNSIAYDDSVCVVTLYYDELCYMVFTCIALYGVCVYCMLLVCSVLWCIVWP